MYPVTLLTYNVHKVVLFKMATDMHPERSHWIGKSEEESERS